MLKNGIIAKLAWTLTIGLFIIGCNNRSKEEVVLEEGVWRGVLKAQGHDLPFNFLLGRKPNGDLYWDLMNDDERIRLDGVIQNGDSVIVPMHIFDATIRARIDNGKLLGTWAKNYDDKYVLDFSATPNEEFRFAKNSESEASFEGKWAVTFIHPEDNDTTEAVGIFNQKGGELTGTFLTPTGDYRFLEGSVQGDKAFLSAFDGEHAFLFHFTKDANGFLTGEFWSGYEWYETWTATKDDNAALPDADGLTYLKDGYETIEFNFPDLEGNVVSPQDEKYQGKVVILQIFGTWCPNCLDETLYYSDWYPKNKDRGVEIIGMAYERKDDYEYARNRVQRMVDKLGVKYDFVIAGTSDKEEAAKTLPMLNHVMAFPTSIFLDRKGNVRRIHTGFTGPGTGEYYREFVEDFNTFMDELLAEEAI